ncbi:hypothetical protein DFA_05274 [Cavenderia fasciculata]|uniref:Uncharacterized protein n=1 Tax=Cavenderia fasciculata TaxID=261658 RepID=F4PNU1_CACFS|nr:uncharacterized protein DFA_05274 [Cavenderia fasciculata]EGG23144.1 hypothetical protein DFA_05274 [Cavenderia fasciculata]|eukprot:XP_004360995.1 hypothetical protein DFA_05274 [Cavenderia fasciculata]
MACTKNGYQYMTKIDHIQYHRDYSCLVIDLSNKDCWYFFVEYVNEGGVYYGTSKKALQDVLDSGKICKLLGIPGIDLIKKAGIPAKFISILPPNDQQELKMLGRAIPVNRIEIDNDPHFIVSHELCSILLSDIQQQQSKFVMEEPTIEFVELVCSLQPKGKTKGKKATKDTTTTTAADESKLKLDSQRTDNTIQSMRWLLYLLVKSLPTVQIESINLICKYFIPNETSVWTLLPPDVRLALLQSIIQYITTTTNFDIKSTQHRDLIIQLINSISTSLQQQWKELNDFITTTNIIYTDQARELKYLILKDLLPTNFGKQIIENKILYNQIISKGLIDSNQIVKTATIKLISNSTTSIDYSIQFNSIIDNLESLFKEEKREKKVEKKQWAIDIIESIFTKRFFDPLIKSQQSNLYILKLFKIIFENLNQDNFNQFKKITNNFELYKLEIINILILLISNGSNEMITFSIETLKDLKLTDFEKKRVSKQFYHTMVQIIHKKNSIGLNLIELINIINIEPFIPTLTRLLVLELDKDSLGPDNVYKYLKCLSNLIDRFNLAPYHHKIVNTIGGYFYYRIFIGESYQPSDRFSHIRLCAIQIFGNLYNNQNMERWLEILCGILLNQDVPRVKQTVLNIIQRMANPTMNATNIKKIFQSMDRFVDDRVSELDEVKYKGYRLKDDDYDGYHEDFSNVEDAYMVVLSNCDRDQLSLAIKETNLVDSAVGNIRNEHVRETRSMYFRILSKLLSFDNVLEKYNAKFVVKTMQDFTTSEKTSEILCKLAKLMANERKEESSLEVPPFAKDVLDYLLGEKSSKSKCWMESTLLLIRFSNEKEIIEMEMEKAINLIKIEIQNGKFLINYEILDHLYNLIILNNRFDINRDYLILPNIQKAITELDQKGGDKERELTRKWKTYLNDLIFPQFNQLSEQIQSVIKQCPDFI